MASVSSWLAKVLLFQWILVTVNLVQFCFGKCSTLNTPGFTLPEGDITLLEGEPLQIFCSLNDDYMKQHVNTTSENLMFTYSEKLVSPEYVNIINASTIRLYMEKPPANIYTFTCALKDSDFGICLNKVIVGLKPQQVNFSCFSDNYDNLTCSWDTPQYYVKTFYNLTYHFPGRSSRVMYNCPNMSKTADNKMFCYWDIETRPHYRHSQPYYYFYLYMHNIFGNHTQRYNFDHFANVIPRPPENLTVEKKSVNSIRLSWLLSYRMTNFPPGVRYKIAYQSEYDDKNTWTVILWKKTNSSNDNNNNVSYTLHGLKYAHALYDIRISMRSEKASNVESMWSKNASITARTMSTIPGAAPKVNVGSFEIVNNRTNRDIYVYWQYISEQLKNGENFSYKVISVKEDLIEKNIKPVEITDAYARFVNVSRRSYTFEIVSSNEIGNSRESSIIFVPTYGNRVPEPASFIKISFENRVYELSWIPPKSPNVPIHTYTIYYCRNNYDRPFQCKGYLEWVEVPSNVSFKNITVPEEEMYQFAISANTKTASSGMVWASCTVIHDRAATKMKNVWIDSIGSDFIEVGWKLECSDQIGSVEGFIIFYCPIVSPVESICKDKERNVTLNYDPIVSRGKITNLRPYTTYMLTVSVLSKHSRGLQSDPLYNTTLEAAPDPPENVTFTKVTNSSVTIHWSRPKAFNGVLRYYEVHVHHDNNVLMRVKPENERNTDVEVKKLNSFTEYNITVFAWTAFCSKPSNIVRIRTAISVPGQMKSPSIKFQNDSLILIDWVPPVVVGGHLDFYELRIKENINAHNVTKIFNTTGLQWELPNCGTEESKKILYFSVRAVNVDKQKRFEGSWSPETENYCRSSSSLIYWFIAIMIALCFVLLILFASKKLWHHCKIMRDVEVKLPPGLAPTITNDVSLNHWPIASLQKSPNNDPLMHLRTNSSADEELLLSKKIECGAGDTHHCITTSADSSGCSSGHESVTSSLASGTNLTSTSDSGTEQPRTPTSDSASRENSLRQRRSAAGAEGWDSEIAWPNTKGYMLTMPIIDKSTLSPSLSPLPSSSTWKALKSPQTPTQAASTNYCVLGVSTDINHEKTPSSTETDIETGYVPILQPQMEHLHAVKNPSYVTCDTMFNVSANANANTSPNATTAPVGDTAYIKSNDISLLPRTQDKSVASLSSVPTLVPASASPLTPTYVLAAAAVVDNHVSTVPASKLLHIQQIDNTTNTVADTSTISADKESLPYVKTGHIVTEQDDIVTDISTMKDDGVLSFKDSAVDSRDSSCSPSSSYCRMGWSNRELQPHLQRQPQQYQQQPQPPDKTSANSEIVYGPGSGAVSDTTLNPSSDPIHTKGYVPHRHFESKFLKED